MVLNPKDGNERRTAGNLWIYQSDAGLISGTHNFLLKITAFLFIIVSE